MANPLDLTVEVDLDTAEIEGISRPGPAPMASVIEIRSIRREVVGDDVGCSVQSLLPQHGAIAADGGHGQVLLPRSRGPVQGALRLGHGEDIFRAGDVLGPDEGAIGRIHLDHISLSAVHHENGARLIASHEPRAIEEAIGSFNGHPQTIVAAPPSGRVVALGPDDASIGSIQPGHPALLAVARPACHDVIGPVLRLINRDAEARRSLDAPRPHQGTGLPMDPVNAGHVLRHEHQADVALTVGHPPVDLARRPVREHAFPLDVSVVGRRSRNDLRQD